MKVKKVLFKVVAIITIISTSLSTMAFAAEPSVDWSTVEPSQEFIEYYSDFFENPNMYWVTDKNGVDVTSTFWATYYSDYLSNSFNHIFAYIMNNDCTLEWDSTPQSNTAVSTQATFLTYTISHTFYKTIDISELKNGTTVGVRYTVKGSYTVNDGYNRIISQTNTELDINQFTHGKDYPCYLESTTTSQSISSDHKSADFNASFTVRIVYEIYGTYVPLEKIVSSPIQGHIRGNTSGKLTNYWT